MNEERTTAYPNEGMPQCGTKEPHPNDEWARTFQQKPSPIKPGSIEQIAALHEAYERAHRQPSDPVNHPAHYNRGKIEVLDFILDQHLDFLLGNVVKYICRAGHKDVDAELTDLNKARFYLDYRIALMKKKP